MRSVRNIWARTKTKESKSICWRPKLEEIEAMTGWKIADVKRL